MWIFGIGLVWISFGYHAWSLSCPEYENAVILAFGDSLTHGTTSPRLQTAHPYTLKLHEYLPSAKFIEKGNPGEVTSHMLERLKVELASLSRAPDVVLILGGTNDIGMRMPEHVVTNIVTMHDDIRMLKNKYPNKYGNIKHTVLMTIPRMTNDWSRKTRIDINHELRHYVSRNSQQNGGDGFTLLLDLENVFTFTPCVPSGPNDRCDPEDYNVKNKRFWDKASPLHFSEEGYDEIGKMVFQTLCGDS